MSLLALDLGGTKLATALFSNEGEINTKQTVALNGRTGKLVGEMIAHEVRQFLKIGIVDAVGIAVPGIYSAQNGTVWAPNIPGWNYYPLQKEIQSLLPGIPLVIDSDRACYIFGEIWHGNAKECNDAIFIAVGTGIGAGIVSGGNVIRGSHDIAGAIGWMALHPPYKEFYNACGCFETHASGEGIRKMFIARCDEPLSASQQHHLTANDVFVKLEQGDIVAKQVIDDCILYWGMAVANLVSLFNPRKIIFGGGVFGPGQKFLPNIKQEAAKWAQPVSMKQVELCTSALGNDAGLYGAAYLAMKLASSKK